MKNKNRLVSRLYYISASAFILYAIYFISIILADIFMNAQIDNFTIMPSHLTGYPVKADLQLRTFDSLIEYKGSDYLDKTSITRQSMGSIFIDNGKSVSTRKDIKEIINDTAYQKNIIIQEASAYAGATPIDDNFDIIEVASGQKEAIILLKPKNAYLSALLATRSYMGGVCILIILGQLARLFRQLNTTFTFNRSIGHALWFIGNCLLVYQVLIFIFSLITKQFIENIIYNESVPDSGYLSRQVFTFRIASEGSFTVIFIGLSLVVLSKLLDYGQQLQEENDLTV